MKSVKSLSRRISPSKSHHLRHCEHIYTHRRTAMPVSVIPSVAIRNNNNRFQCVWRVRFTRIHAVPFPFPYTHRHPSILCSFYYVRSVFQHLWKCVRAIKLICRTSAVDWKGLRVWSIACDVRRHQIGNNWHDIIIAQWKLIQSSINYYLSSSIACKCAPQYSTGLIGCAAYGRQWKADIVAH